MFDRLARELDVEDVATATEILGSAGLSDGERFERLLALAPSEHAQLLREFIQPSSTKPVPPDDVRSRHEAGHAVVAWALGATVDLVTIDQVDVEGGAAHGLAHSTFPPLAEGDLLARRLTVMVAGGLASQDLSDSIEGAQADLAAATVLLIETLQPEDHVENTADSLSAASAGFAVGVSLLDQALAGARQLLDDHDHVVRALAAAVQEHRTLDSALVNRVIRAALIAEAGRVQAPNGWRAT